MTIMLLEWVFTSAFLILVVLALRAALGKRISAGMRYALWAVVLVRLLVPVQLFTSPIAGTRIFTETRIEQDTADWPSAPAPLPSAPADAIGLPVKDAAPGGVPTLPSPPDVPDAPEAPAAPDLSKAPAWLGWTWLAGSGAAVLALLLSNLRFWRRLRRTRVPLEGTDSPVPVYTAQGLPSPCLFGLPRPAVYVTPEAAADPDMLRHVLAHELTHYRHGDHIWSLLRCAALAAHWWNPLVWLAAGLSQRDSELACDEGALKRLGDGERAGYGNTLLSLVTAKPGPGDLMRCATTMAGDKKSLKERISRIACAPKRILWAAVAVVLVTALACVCAFGKAAEESEDGPEDFLPVWPYGVSEMTYVRDEGGFYGDFTITLRYDGSFTYYEGLASSYIGMGAWGRNGDVVRLADEGLKDSAGIQYYYFKIVDGGLAFQAENSAKFMYVDVADGDRFSRNAAAAGAEIRDPAPVDVEIAFPHTGNDSASSFYVPAEVLKAAKDYVAKEFRGFAPYGWGTRIYDRGQWVLAGISDPAYFDRVRINHMKGPWVENRQGVQVGVWRINYEYHTTMPEKEKPRLAGGMYLTEDGWKCPTYPDSTYLFFQVEGDKLRFLTGDMWNIAGPDEDGFDKDGFYSRVDAYLEEELTNPPQTDLNRNGVPEELRVMSGDEGMGEELEVWEGGSRIYVEEGYFAHVGYNSLFLCTLDGEDYLLRYHPTMYQGYCTYNYQLFTLEGGQETVVRENSVRFDICFAPLMHESFEPEAIAAFMDEINGLLARSVQLINTDDYLLDTFQEEGRLYDSLWWLDTFEGTFTRDSSKSLLENLRDFKAAMEAEQYAESPEVFPVDELGKDIRLSYGDKQTRFSCPGWEYEFQPADQVHPQVLDLNGDGKNEIVFILVMGHGTGAMEQQLYIFDAGTLKQYDTAGLTKRLIRQVKSTGDDQYFYLSAPGMEQVSIPKDAAGVGPTPNAIELGSIVEYSLSHGVLCCRLGCDASGRTLEYCGEIQAVLTMDRQGGISASSFAYAPYEQYEAGSPMEEAHRRYRYVLLGVDPFAYTEDGQAARRVYVSGIPGLFPLGDDGYTAVDKFAAADLDGDGIPEPVMRVIAAAGDAGGFVVLDQRGGTVYGLKAGYQTFRDLKKDGTFIYSAGLESGAAALDMGTGRLVKHFYSVLDHGTDRYSYYVDGKNVSQKEYEAAEAQQDGKPDAIWYAFNPTNVRAVFP